VFIVAIVTLKSDYVEWPSALNFSTVFNRICVPFFSHLWGREGKGIKPHLSNVFECRNWTLYWKRLALRGLTSLFKVCSAVKRLLVLNSIKLPVTLDSGNGSNRRQQQQQRVKVRGKEVERKTTCVIRWILFLFYYRIFCVLLRKRDNKMANEIATFIL
jgi:hypothetical protein